MDNYANHIFWLIERRKQYIEYLKEMLRGTYSDTATVSEPWASMTTKEIKESMGNY
ncbi:hypothetical protein KMD50_gp48 [Lactococcus phage PLgW-1]|uniref:Uncharacterized protein n=3 Tax=Uwajimavirus PLgW1 TaxID=2845441 RepID=A0A2Z2P8L5_9CAUD|nr:hypothetical protein KMD50_gp48 [Lactococcus phage PLgW-1]ARQ94859.1 hypothetical protein PLgW1_48 [Lactococcus phage PLgW-1]ASJ80031.1 hypothetical protein [Lactococcus phage PLgY-16]ASJ80084.1 hypothetical protein [Lactococcus phage PLgY-30]